MLPYHELKILSLLYFDESFESIVNESGFGEMMTAACIRNLVKERLVTPTITKGDKTVVMRMYDVDRMSAYRFRATAAGITMLEKYKNNLV